jgi:hypothetical protein
MHGHMHVKLQRGVTWSFWTHTAKLWSKSRKHSATTLKYVELQACVIYQSANEKQNMWINSQILCTIPKEVYRKLTEQPNT